MRESSVAGAETSDTANRDSSKLHVKMLADAKVFCVMYL